MKLNLKNFTTSLLFLLGFLLFYKFLNSIMPSTGRWTFLYPLMLLILALVLIVVVSSIMKKRERLDEDKKQGHQ
ncbi:MAG: hypothetical protein BBJ60_07770 [Desulfobacterales bacterium S7086C20]|nr:MAG: hypothetical protein BBJ60_07770 [Desulfobacterales bacterium S7086C20]